MLMKGANYMAHEDYVQRKQAEDRQRYNLICEYIAQGKTISVADQRFYNFYRICVLKKGEK